LSLTPDTNSSNSDISEKITMIHENMPKLGITEVYSISNNANLEEIDNIPDNEVETKLEFTIPTFQLKLILHLNPENYYLDKNLQEKMF
jgi:hypothetical protein